MSYSYLLLWCVVSTLVVTPHASPVKMDNQVHTVNIRLIEESHDHPMKRSAHHSVDAQTLNLPDHLVFGVPGDRTSSETVLRLKRATLIPMVTSSGEIIPPDQSASVYTDPSLHSAMIVRRESEQYTLEGTFLRSGMEWNLKPMGKNVTDKSAHQLDKKSFKGDLHRGLVKSKAKRSASNLVWHKREEKEVLTIETAFVIDFYAFMDLYRFFGPAKVSSELGLFYSYVAEAVNLRYQTLDYEDIEVKFKVLSIKLIRRHTDDAFIQDQIEDGVVSLEPGMIAFTDWFWSQDDTYEETDYHVLFSGFEFPELEYPSFSFLDSMCENSAGSLVLQILDGSLSFLVARELAIVFGLDDADLGCGVDASLSQANPWGFSDCTADLLYGKLQSDIICLNPAATSSDTGRPFPEDSARAGQVLHRDAQCQLSFQNEEASYCPESQGEEGTICGGMYCKRHVAETECWEIIAQEFTTCGENMWCELGQCVTNSTTEPPPSAVAEKACRKMRLRPRKWIACIRKIMKL